MVPLAPTPNLMLGLPDRLAYSPVRQALGGDSAAEVGGYCGPNLTRCLTRHSPERSILHMPSQVQAMRKRTTSRVERARLQLMADHYKVELGRAIKRRREELGLTQKDLAELTHYKEAQTVSRWERGENSPGDLEVVARALQWSLADLVAGIDPPNRRTARRFGIAVEPPTDLPGGLEDLVSGLAEQVRLLRAETAARDAEVLKRIDEALRSTQRSQGQPPQ